MSSLNWTQKFKAIVAVSRYREASLRMRDDCSWYVSSMGVDRKEGGMLSGGCQSGISPEDAVEQWWSWATDPKYYLITRGTDDKRRAVRWNGFMWEDVNEQS